MLWKLNDIGVEVWNAIKVAERLEGYYYVEDSFGRGCWDGCPLYGAVLIPDEVEPTVSLLFCDVCYTESAKGRVPKFAIGNCLGFGGVPPVLGRLTYIEEMMIARARGVGRIVKLQVVGSDAEGRLLRQRAIVGNVIVLATSLPIAVSDLCEHVTVLFTSQVELSASEMELLLRRCKGLRVRRNAVNDALLWLKTHNEQYASVSANDAIIYSLPADGVCRRW
ncbi:hypothetical protein HK097_008591 [Rhizophlyctis rosea]|uniref:DUF6570 domain-containing protein n=1 Tax=Rhizophlyctis rosea TaxID=64517 RepID=A0AAD5SCV8_9FUNG|nr:hypothetical protein HK097_008591 [Rhizophlyctis rosea]